MKSVTSILRFAKNLATSAFFLTIVSCGGGGQSIPAGYSLTYVAAKSDVKALGLTDEGMVYGGKHPGATTEYQGWTWKDGVETDITTPISATDAYVSSASGDDLVESIVDGATSNRRAFVRYNGAWTEIPYQIPPGGDSSDSGYVFPGPMNRSGDCVFTSITGSGAHAGKRGYIWKSASEAAHLLKVDVPLGLNNLGLVAGYAERVEISTLIDDAEVGNENGLTILHVSNNQTSSSVAYGVSNHGVVCFGELGNFYTFDGVTKNPILVNDMGLSNYLTPYINDQGYVVITKSDGSGFNGEKATMIRFNSTWIDISTLLTNNDTYDIDSAVGLNNQDQILVEAHPKGTLASDDHTVYLLLTPNR